MFARHKPNLLATCGYFFCFLLVSATAQGEDMVDFVRDVQPILNEHCWKCHGEQQAAGGLRLDQRELAERGGGSGKNSLELPISRNELMRRIRSTKDGVRMPLEGPPLAADQIETLTHWIEQGATWPAHEVEAAKSFGPPPSSVDIWIKRWEAVAAPQYRPVYWSTIGLLVLVLAIERTKDFVRKMKKRATESDAGSTTARPLLPQLAGVSRMWYLVGLMGLALWITNLYWSSEVTRLNASLLSSSRGSSSTLGSGTTTKSHLHDPLRPQHPPRLGGAYYRGNDERGAELFNGGNYRTATFNVHLADADGNKLGWDDAIPERIFIRFEIIRAPHSSPTLFSPDIMAQIGISPVQPEQVETAAEIPLVRLTTVETGERWSALYPLDHIPDQGRLAGKLYVYRNTNGQGAQTLSEPSYLIGYELSATEGLVSRESQIWMASVYNVHSVQWPEPGRIQPNEWFDYRPIPEIQK
ncbi:Planctomycete cytochrome C [Anatilimnocola aggregata]|uniref:Planctomycete cytochrome C n=1 Tax=Anatilimnocola aggregata TaxID=2528021 RepID=A0A517Y6P9_9BACT|nr:c-type cytochrome domain-containing protein [Anatilimnocola aggregata]QDU25911.1 Planctomycete cytochrome C [Anatilimnocola aggregata]